MSRQDDDERRSTPPRLAGEGIRIIGAQEAAEREAQLSSGRLPDDHPRFGDVPPGPEGPRPAVRLPLPEDEEPRPLLGSRPTTPEMPHWTEPPTGEVPRVLGGEPSEEEDDLQAWAGLTSRAPRWREGSDWEEADFEDASILGDARVTSETHAAFAFDDVDDDGNPYEEAPAPAARPQTTRIRTRSLEPPATIVPPSPERNLPVAIAAGLGLGALALLCAWRGPGWLAALATVVVVLAAAEVFDALRRAGYRPATLLGLVATASLMVGAYVKGERAIPLVIALALVFSMLWYLLGVVRGRPTSGLGATLLGFLWVGFLGSFASLLLRYPDREGVAFLLGALVAVVANDVGALFIGRQFGNTPLAPTISPNKTVEGFVGGLVLSLLVTAAIVSRIHPWTLMGAVWLAVLVSLIGPIGDLCESMVKRDLGVKDMGSILPGHGGILDRFDSVLFVLPAVYYLVELLQLAS